MKQKGAITFMSKTVKIVLGIIAVMIVLAAILCGVVFSILNSQKNANYYTLGNDEIISVKSVIGVRNILGVSATIQNGVSEKSYNYTSKTSSEDIKKYLTYLVEEEGFKSTVLNQNGDYPVYVKMSADQGKKLILTMIENGFGYTLTIQKGEGALTTSE